MATRADSFDRANSTNLGSDWAEDSGDWKITSNNVLQDTSGGSYRKLRWVGAAMDSANYSVEAPCRSGTGHTVGPAARMAASSTVSYYALVIFAGFGAYIVYINAGAETILDSSSVTINSSTTYTLRLEVEGTALRGYVNGSLELETTHSALTSGPPGLAAYGGGNASAYATGWTASDLSSGVTGAAAITQAAQTVAAAGVVAAVGAAAITQAAQTVAAAGTVAVVGAAALTQDGQTVLAIGVVAVAGAANMTQDGNTLTAAWIVGNVPIIGSAAITQAAQTVAAGGVVAVAGAASMTQDGQTVAAAGVVAVVGAASILQDGNTITAAGYVGSVPIIGSASITQDNNTVASAGVVAVVGAASVLQDGNTLSAAGAVAVVGAAAITQDGNTVAGTVALDLVLTVVFGTVLGVRAAGTVRGVRSTGGI